jgi:hypothetical protein
MGLDRREPVLNETVLKCAIGPQGTFSGQFECQRAPWRIKARWSSTINVSADLDQICGLSRIDSANPSG